MGYCSPSEVLARMGRGETVSADANANVKDAIDAATAAIDEWCHRAFTATDPDQEEGEARVLPVLGYGRRLDTPDLISVISIKVDDDDDGVFETTLTAADYELDNWHTSGGYVDVGGLTATWPFEFVNLLTRDWPTRTHRRRVVEITGHWGWPTVPAAINQACSMHATRLMQRMQAAPFGVQSFGELGAQSIRSTDPDYLALVEPYRKVGIA